jgi:integrase
VTIGRADVLTPDVARKKALSILGEMADGVDPNQSRKEQEAEKITVKEAFDAFFEAKSKLAACTVDGYSRSRDKYLEDWQKKPIAKVSRQMVLNQHQKITATYGAVTANNVFRHFRSVYNFTAASFDDFPANPVVILTQARAWHREARRRRVITVHDLPQWWQAIMTETDDARDIFIIALFTGMRRSEILRLEWEHVDLVAKTQHQERRSPQPSNVGLSRRSHCRAAREGQAVTVAVSELWRHRPHHGGEVVRQAGCRRDGH